MQYKHVNPKLRLKFRTLDPLLLPTVIPNRLTKVIPSLTAKESLLNLSNSWKYWADVEKYSKHLRKIAFD